MTLEYIAGTRLLVQQIAQSGFTSAKDLVGYMGAMQAQDLEMAKWAVGLRIPGSTIMEIEKMLDKGEIIRTHVLRPTWHLVSPDDIHWMLELTAPRIKPAMKTTDKALELTPAVYSKSNRIILKALEKEGELTRDELAVVLEKNRIATDRNRLSHMLMVAELDMLICSGSFKGKKQTYTLLDERVKKKKILSKEASLQELAKRYFTSHGPATLQDFVWWSGLGVREARQGTEAAAKYLTSQAVGEEAYWFADLPALQQGEPSAHLLPAFDEFIISYRDRAAALTSAQHKKAISDNGIFRPVIMVNGQATGIWKRTVKGNRVMIDALYFKRPSLSMKISVEKAANEFALFLCREMQLTHAVLK